MYLGNPCEFLINIQNADTEALFIAVDGPSKVELDCQEVSEGRIKSEIYLNLK